MFLAGSVAAVYMLYYIILRQDRVRVRAYTHKQYTFPLNSYELKLMHFNNTIQMVCTHNEK